MRLGIVCLVLGYVLSQFYRAFLAVLTPVLGRDVGAGPDDLALSSGLWFLAFALMQLTGWQPAIPPSARNPAQYGLGLVGGLYGGVSGASGPPAPARGGSVLACISL